MNSLRGVGCGALLVMAFAFSGCATAGGGGGGVTIWTQVPSSGLIYFAPGSKDVAISLAASPSGHETITSISVPSHYTYNIIAPASPLPINLNVGQTITIRVTASTGAAFGHMSVNTSAGPVHTTLDPRF